jgi:hypothetical protein
MRRIVAFIIPNMLDEVLSIRTGERVKTAG